MNTYILNIIRIIATVSNLIWFMAFAYFIRLLRWSSQKDRVSIIGFVWMMGMLIVNECLMWL